MSRKLNRMRSQAFLAVTEAAGEPDEDIAYFATVARKIIQRGSLPPTPTAVEFLLLGRAESTRPAETSPESLLAAAVGPMSDHPLDPSIKLDATYEEPLWTTITERLPVLTRFLTPQASLESLLGDAEDATQRWVDFLLTIPWLERSVVIELDGEQHRTASHVDEDRDVALRAAGYVVARHRGPDTTSPASDLFKRLRQTVALAPGGVDETLTALIHGPAVPTRLAAALVELLEAGHLPPGGIWDLEIEDEFGVSPVALAEVLNLLSAIASVWSLPVAPIEVRTQDGLCFTRDGVRYRLAQPTAGRGAQARILLQPFTAAHAALPAQDGRLPTAVIRNAYLPVDLPWMPSSSSDRRNIDPDRSGVDEGLRVLLEHMFGFDNFRDGQLEALKRALAGDDSCVLLPTGAGKSLIYQLAGVLRPGVTLVVDPLVSLIDDQERRLRADGFERMAALHQAKVSTAATRDAAYRAVADGAAFFVFLTPERLQSQAFRDALDEAASRQLVNLAVVDEAHCVSEWGHDFRTAYLRLGRNLRALCRGYDEVAPPLMALTGTASPAVLRDVMRELEDERRPMHLQKPATFDRANLRYGVLSGSPEAWPARLREALTKDLPEALNCDVADLLRLEGPDTRSGLVFVPWVNGAFGLVAVRKRVRTFIADAVAESETQLDDAARSPIEIYSGKPPKDHPGGRRAWDTDKVAAADRFKDNRAAILVSTKAFGMGIDKPNIRWTIHVGFPSSIEAFAQEAGRAGRDGKPSHCLLVASPPPPERAEAILDLQLPREQRLATYNEKGHADDLQRQMFFLTGNFAGVETEFRQAVEVLDFLLVAGPTNRIEIPRKGDTGKEPGAKEQEKALYRLSMLGLVEDYTVDHGAKKFVVDVDDYSVAHIDRALMRFIDRVEPGKTALRRRQLRHAPADLLPRIHHHLRLLLHTLYDVIEPARVRALTEMYRLVIDSEDDTDIRTRILAYLSDGPLAGILLDVATASAVDVHEATRLLDTVPALDPREWIGAAARQLEAYPDHPVLLLVRAMGEALTPDPDVSLVHATARDAFTSFGLYDVSSEEGAWLFTWATAQLRNQHSGRGWPLLPLFYRAWTEAGCGDEALVDLEDRVLTMVGAGEYHPAELRAVLERRLLRQAETVRSMSRTRTGNLVTNGSV